MPIYAYACAKCEHEFDALQKMSDDPLVECPACGEPALRKLLSAPKFRLKGSGWYETDFKSGNQRNLAGEKESKPESKSKDTAAEKPAPKAADSASTSTG